MYSFQQSEQLKLFLLSLGAGFFLGIIYDILRTVRLSFTRSKAAIFIFDILYFLIFGLFTFLFILAVNKGEIRFYLLFGEALGAVIYYFSFGIAAIKISDKIVKGVRTFFRVLFKVISAPFRFIFRIIKKIFSKVSAVFRKKQKKCKKNCKKLLPKLRLYVYNLRGIFKSRKGVSRGGETEHESDEKEA